jgi:hypothetical protein
MNLVVTQGLADSSFVGRRIPTRSGKASPGWGRSIWDGC